MRKLESDKSKEIDEKLMLLSVPKLLSHWKDKRKEIFLKKIKSNKLFDEKRIKMKTLKIKGTLSRKKVSKRKLKKLL